ncbi:MAG TPA: SRPBCC family protein [Acidimicrobiia bacterium]
MRLHEQRRVRRPQDEVFEYTADFANIEDWDPGVAASGRRGEGPIGVGTSFDLEVRFGRSVIPMVYEITEFERSRRVVLVGKGKTLDAVDEIRFRTEEGKTVIDYTADLTFHNWIKYVDPLLAPFLKGVGRRAVDGLVSALGG